MDPGECSVSDQMMKFILFWVCWVPYYKINHVFSQNADTVTSSSSVTGNNATVTEKPDATPTPSVESVASEASSAPSTATLVNEATTTETSPVQETASPADPTPAPALAPAPASQVSLVNVCLFVCMLWNYTVHVHVYLVIFTLEKIQYAEFTYSIVCH